MLSAPLPANEIDRLAALRRYEILDTAEEAEFNDFTRLASQVCGTPIALISLIDEGRQWFKSHYGLNITETPREVAFCAHAILGDGICEVPDALQDVRFEDNPLVTGSQDVRFYAGIPLTTSDGLNMGTLCVVDRIPRFLTEPQRESLTILGRQVVTQMDLRLAKRQSTSIVDSSEDAIISKKLNGVITSWNRGAELLFGYTPEEAIGRPLLFLIPSERQEEEKTILDKIARGEKVNHYETVRLRKDGSPVCVSLSIFPVRDAMNRIVGAAKICRDISERKNSEMLLRRALKDVGDMKAALDEHSLVATTDEKGIITYVNDKFCAISKYSREELLGQDHRMVNSGYHPKGFFAEFWRTIQSGRPWRGEIRNRAKDGSFYWVDTTIYPVIDDLGMPSQYISIRTDITSLKEHEEKLQALARELKEKNRDLESLFNIVSHDLRAPLVNVQGFGRQLEQACNKLGASAAKLDPATGEEFRQPLEVTIPRALKFIHAGIFKMDSLLNGFVRFCRLGRLSLTIRPIHMNTMMASVVEAMQFQITQAKAEIRIEMLPDCLGDMNQTNQIFSNLIDNALKYRSADRPLVITISGRAEDNLAVYTVNDTGIGIKPEHLHKIFEIFHRLDPKATPGEGLGLTIAQRILERQNGRLYVESESGVGSSFHISLPSVAVPS